MLFPYPEATKRLLQYFSSFELRHKEKLVPKKTYLNAQQIIDALKAVKESHAEIVKNDPKCLKPENRQLGYEMWKMWGGIRPNLNTVSGWNIKEYDSKKALGWGSVGKREETADEQEI